MTNSSSDPIETGEQTQFGADAWLYDANKFVPVEPNPNQVKVPFWQTGQGKVVIVAVAFVSIIVLLAVWAMMARQMRGGSGQQITDQTPVLNMDLGPLGERVKALNLELKAADPTKELDPFPPLNLEARLDEPTI